ncbi:MULTISPECIES: type I-D CRISPR-associated endonuclease Cas1d [unclassified Anabaena]|uniref:type I-D CRISPR-associated endonuclease Cas1d n=1 Tax=unclassified Anabaena TaxID=2619674 RepID=UPI001444F519|nr:MULTISPECIES: type I-D CRISPR-associated endonuclease Cas1d [unclassified Anabaena]MTJ09715.1 type I-D CRISPR-associated endonuclease Cas1 [Anabaena sp. UHCC 0204]MTJ54081.1 type I-D CRISPR-associated endonuclease Cas1 [Anabaena sp. UHCC 0253]
MSTLYVTQNDAFIGKVDERIHVKFEKKILQDIPFIHLKDVVVLGRATISPAVVSELMTRHIPLSFINEMGHYLGRLEPEMTKNIFVRKAQWQAAGESSQAVHVVQSFVRGKLKNYRQILMRCQRESDVDLSKYITRIEQTIAPIDSTHNINSLRGLEGAGSAAYFGCFNQLIRNPDFTFTKRVRRPATDPVNSLLGFGYSLLRHDIQGAVNIVGFDPYLGYLHCDRYGRPSLPLDLMEEFRPLVVDSVVLSILNKQLLTPGDFVTEPLSGAVHLTPEGRKTFLIQYQKKKLSEFKHPVMGRKCSYRQAFEWQARLLAKYLMGETDKYPPLFLK